MTRPWPPWPRAVDKSRSERGPVSRRLLTATDALDWSKHWAEEAAGHRPALLWSAPAERSGDGALARLQTEMETSGSGA